MLPREGRATLVTARTPSRGSSFGRFDLFWGRRCCVVPEPRMPQGVGQTDSFHRVLRHKPGDQVLQPSIHRIRDKQRRVLYPVVQISQLLVLFATLAHERWASKLDAKYRGPERITIR